MSVKHYGIYLAYPPTVDLRHEGLGRYLAAFLKGAAQRNDVRFVLVCPSWSRESLESLFEAEGVPLDCFEVIAPKKIPVALRLYQKWLVSQARRRSSSRLVRFFKKLGLSWNYFIELLLSKLVTADSIPAFIIRLLPVVGLGALVILLTPLWLILGLGFAVKLIGRRLYHRFGRRFGRLRQRFRRVLGQPKDDAAVVNMYRALEEHEGRRMQVLIDALPKVRAWYSPTAFWPAFNKINAPRLMCVPDVVLADFAVGFAGVGGDRFLQNFQQMQAAIYGGSHFVTYSDSVKWDTLVDCYAISPHNVTVVHHAPNDLGRWVNVRGITDPDAASNKYCRALLGNAIRSSYRRAYTRGFLNDSLQFLFYASQVRPNKNIITLLKAYEYLLRRRLIGHKLILTGRPVDVPSVKGFVARHRLENEVLFLHGLKIHELAACYKLADLAVNPSLSEGGCPFTFTEALSVNTPVVMARIPVTEEVLVDDEVQRMTFFDPYDWKDMADRIEWALSHRNELLAVQRKTYEGLAQRTWCDVVDEHIQALDRIFEADVLERAERPDSLAVAKECSD